MRAQVAMYPTALDADSHTQVDRSPVRVCDVLALELDETLHYHHHCHHHHIIIVILVVIIVASFHTRCLAIGTFAV